MAKFEKVALVSDVPAGQSKKVVCNGEEIALCNVGGKIHAIENSCPHRGGPLAEGTLSGTIVTCPWHNWKFDVTTGQSPVVPDAEVKTFKTKIEGDSVFVEV